MDGRTSLYVLIANPHSESPYNGRTGIELEVTTEALWPRLDHVSVGLEIGITTRNNITGWGGESVRPVHGEQQSLLLWLW